MMMIPCILLLLQATPPKVEIEIDVTEVPEVQEWALKAKELCEKWYPLLLAEIPTPGFTPPRKMKLVFKDQKKGVASTSGTTVTINSNWIKQRPDDFGMAIHEMVHVIQNYPNGNPGWVTDGIADYLRYVKFEGRAIPPKEKRKGDFRRDSYWVAGAFLAWIQATYDKDLVKKLNDAMRQKKYKDEIFVEWTKKDLDTLWTEYAAPK